MYESGKSSPYDNRGEPLTESHRRSQVYMDVADERLRSLGCYDN